MKNKKEVPTDKEVLAWANKQKLAFVIRNPQDMEDARQAMMEESNYQQGYKDGQSILKNIAKIASRVKKGKKKGPAGPRTMEVIAMSTLKKGQVFYTQKPDKDITAIASVNKVKVKTTRLFTIDSQGATEKIVRVEIL